MSPDLYPTITENINGIDEKLSLDERAFRKERQVYVYCPINSETAKSVIQKLRYLKAISDDPITLHINSPGGSVSDGMAIYDVIKYEVSPECKVITIAEGIAASMGAILLSCTAEKGNRYALPSAEIMIHQPLGGAQGQASDIVLTAKRIDKIKKKLAALLADATGRSENKILKDMDRDNWFSAREAVKYGLIDHIGLPGREVKEDE